MSLKHYTEKVCKYMYVHVVQHSNTICRDDVQYWRTSTDDDIDDDMMMMMM